MASGAGTEDLDRAIAAIDAANADDPATLVVAGRRRPKEQAHAEMATEWVRRLRPDAPPALLLAARAHHVRRWEIPRSAEPEGRQGYLRWKRRLQRHHADVVGRVLADVGVAPATIERVQALVRKEHLRTDPDARTLEDALALVFLETQLSDLADQLGDDDHMVDVLARTLRKMSPDGRAAGAALPLGDRERDLLRRAVGAASIEEGAPAES